MFEFFYDVAVYANENWRGKFTPKEIAVNAYLYTQDALASTSDTPQGSIVTLIEQLVEDMSNGSKEAERYYDKLLEWLDV